MQHVKKLQSFPSWPRSLIQSSSSSRTFPNLHFHVFRDDLLSIKMMEDLPPRENCYGSEKAWQDLNSKCLSGNKLRKLQFLLSQSCWMNNHDDDIHNNNRFGDFNDLTLEYDFNNLKEIRSYGSIQSNAMLSIAYLCFRLGISFKYFVERDLNYVESNSQFGNLFHVMQLRSQGLQMEFIPLTERQDYERMKHDFYCRTVSQRKSFDEKSGVLYLREGVSQHEAQIGYSQMALELNDAIQELVRSSRSKKHQFNVFLPSGTGTSALFLSKYLLQMNQSSCNNSARFQVFTTNCVGSVQYLQNQFCELEPNDSSIYPKILQTTKKYRYGQLYKEMYEMIQNLKNEIGVQFEYLYDAKGFLALKEQHDIFLHDPYVEHSTSTKNHVIYIHSGGLLGNTPMEDRYRRFLMKTRE
nr:unnamed protein product [Naegleria fowleri]